MANKEEKATEPAPRRYIVKEGVVYVEINGTLTRNYISVNGERKHVLNIKPGEKCTVEELDTLNAKK